MDVAQEIDKQRLNAFTSQSNEMSDLDSFENPIDYIICECGVDFKSENDLQEHLEKEHVETTSKSDDDNEDFYLLEVQNETESTSSPSNESEFLSLTDSENTAKTRSCNPETGMLDVGVGLVVNYDEIESLKPTDMPVVEVQDETQKCVKNSTDFQQAPSSDIEIKQEIQEYVVLNSNLIPEGQIVNFDDDLTNEVVVGENQNYIFDVKGLKLEVPSSKQLSVDPLRFCELCTKVFVGSEAFRAHWKAEHKDVTNIPGLKKVKMKTVCDICGRIFATINSLRNHQFTHTGERPHECSGCGRAFSMKLNMQIHERIHTGEKPYQCELCPKAFRNKAAINRHHRVHSGEKPYPCPECGKMFSQSNSMKWHVRTVHWHEPWPYKKKKKPRLAST